MTPAYEIAQRFVGQVRELPGGKHHPFVQWAHLLCGLGPDQPDETPWCSSCLNAFHFIAGLPMSYSAAARSWLRVGRDTPLAEALRGDVVVLSRGTNPAHGHVGLLDRLEDGHVFLLGGNQANAITVASFPTTQIISVRRCTQP